MASYPYTKGMACAICQIRRPRRFCPGVHGDICTLCCGTEREVSISCPLDCPHLQDARKHERPAEEAHDTQVPNQDISVTEQMLQENEQLLMLLGAELATAALAMPGTVDSDVREALDAVIRTYRTLQSGIYYEDLPANVVAANLYRVIQDHTSAFRQEETNRLGMAKTRDNDVLALLVFLQRLEWDRNNGRRRGRAFIDLLHQLHRVESEATASTTTPLLLP